MRYLYNTLTLLILLFSLQSISAQQNAPVPRRTLPPMLKDGKIAAYITFNRPLITQAMVLNNPEGIGYEEEVYLGSRGIKPSADTLEPYFAFQIATDQLVQTTGTFYVSVQYLDLGQSSIGIEFFQLPEEDEDPPLQEKTIFLGNSGFWKEHSFKIENAFFDHLFENDNDLRLYCPDVLIQHISVSRAPLGKPVEQQFNAFRQTPIHAPIGYQFSLHLSRATINTIQDNPALLQNKLTLYQSWGTQFILETIHIDELLQKIPAGKPHPLFQRAEQIQQQNLTWVPRFKIGDIGQLPADWLKDLQRAEPPQSDAPGPMISLWEPKLDRIYSDLFLQMKKLSGTTKIHKLSLSFAGDWGPLLLSSEQSGGHPNFWTGDPYARQSFSAYLRSQYGSLSLLSAQWQTRLSSWDHAVVFPVENSNTTARQDWMTWYQQSLVTRINNIAQAARNAFPKAALEIEVGDRYLHPGQNYALLAGLASRMNASLVMATDTENPTQSYTWQLLSSAARRSGIPFGIRPIRNPDSTTLLTALYALAGDGGNLLHFSEENMKPQNAWSLFASASVGIRPSNPQRNLAVIFPQTSIHTANDQRFTGMIADLRERIAFDLISEQDISLITSSQYPFILVPWGSIWQPATLERFESLARGGSALIVKMGRPWLTSNGDMSINERLFAGKLELRNGEWMMVPHSDTTQLTSQNPQVSADNPTLILGQPGDEAYLSGKWNEPSREAASQQFRFPFQSFRWFRERAVSTLPLIPNRDYELEIEGYVHPDHPILVYMDNRQIGTISGAGVTRWRMPLEGALRPRRSAVQIMLRGQEWNTGHEIGAERPSTVTMAVSRIALHPQEPQTPDASDPTTNAAVFDKQLLRGSYLREVGRGITLLMPNQNVTDWLYYELISHAAANPQLLDPRYRFQSPADGEVNRIFTSPQSGWNVYLNLNDNPVQVGAKQNLPLQTIPPLSIHYSF